MTTTTNNNNVEDMLRPHELRFLSYGLKRREQAEVVESVKRMRYSRHAGQGGEGGDQPEEPLRISVLRSRLPPALKRQLFDQLERPQCDKYVRWVRHLLRVPIRSPCAPSVVLSRHVDPATGVALAAAALDAKSSGFVEAKREVLKIVCQQLCSGRAAAPTYALGLEGPAGTGKSHFVRHAMAAALQRPVAYIPLGGATDVSHLLGHGYTYEESRPGRLATALMDAGCSNPILFFDELDKISKTPKGEEISATLIHLIDPTTNDAVQDRYLQGLDLDFSQCTFVFTYNDPALVSPILLDRIQRIAVPAMSDSDKADVLRKHMLPRVQAKLHTKLTLSDEAISEIVARNASGAGMRQAERDVEAAVSTAQLTAVQGRLDPEKLAPIGKAFLDTVLPPPAAAGEAAAPPEGMYL